MKQTTVTWFLVFSYAFFIASSELSADDSSVLLSTVDDRFHVTVDDLENYVAAKNLTRPTGAPEGKVEPDKLEFLAEQVLRQKVLSYLARENGRLSEHQLSSISAYETSRVLMEAEIQAKASEILKSRNWELVAKEYYRANKKEFMTEAQVRARHILIKPDSSGWASAIATAEAVQQQLLAGADFGTLAKTYSQDPSALANNGDLGFFGRGRMFPTFEAAAFSLDVGQISELVVTPFGVHVIEVTARRDSELLPFEKVSATLIKRLKDRRYADAERDVLLGVLIMEGGRSAVEYNEENIDLYREALGS